VAAGGDISGFVFTGDVYVGEYERLADARQYTDGLVAELDLAHFAGRQWLLDVVDEFLRSEDRGYFVLEADAGLGKTTFCAWLARSRGYPVHFVQIQGGADPAAAWPRSSSMTSGWTSSRRAGCCRPRWEARTGSRGCWLRQVPGRGTSAGRWCW
jgi:predicted transcriptional regulator